MKIVTNFVILFQHISMFFRMWDKQTMCKLHSFDMLVVHLDVESTIKNTIKMWISNEETHYVSEHALEETITT